MSLFLIIVGCALIIGGIWDVAVSLRYLKTTRGKSELAKAGGRTSKWQFFLSRLIQVVLGVLFVGNWIENDTARLLLAITSVLLLTWLCSSYLKSWRRSRQERKQKPAAEHTWFLTRLEDSPFAHRMAAAAEDWEALQDRKANLDKRVENGELASDTAARYLAAHRRLLIEGLGYNRPIRWPERMLVSALLPFLAAQSAKRAARRPRYQAEH